MHSWTSSLKFIRIDCIHCANAMYANCWLGSVGDSSHLHIGIGERQAACHVWHLTFSAIRLTWPVTIHTITERPIALVLTIFFLPLAGRQFKMAFLKIDDHMFMLLEGSFKNVITVIIDIVVIVVILLCLLRIGSVHSRKRTPQACSIWHRRKMSTFCF